MGAGVQPILTVRSRMAAKNCAVDLSAPSKAPKENPADLQPTRFLPTDGIVKATAIDIAKNAKGCREGTSNLRMDRRQHLRNPKTRGCGVGDIRFLLESRDLGGKCADLNVLYVGRARAAGLPARDVYGICVAKSEMGYKSLGVSSEKVTKAQHSAAS